MSVEATLGEGTALYLERIQQTSPPKPGEFQLYAPSKCNPKYIILQCGCGRRIVPSTCMSLDCKNCAEFVRDRRRWRTLDRLMSYANHGKMRYVRQPVLYTVFTVPEEVRYKYANRESWAKLRRRAWKLLHKQFAAMFGVECTHPTGDRDPVHFHPHLNFLWKQKPGHRGFIDVQRLRALWAQILGVDNVDVHHEYSHKLGKISHWVRYVVRTFPGTHTWTGPLRWFGRYPKGRGHPHSCLCPDCGQQVKYIGWLLADTVDDWYKYGEPTGGDPPWERGAFAR